MGGLRKTLGTPPPGSLYQMQMRGRQRLPAAIVANVALRTGLVGVDEQVVCIGLSLRCVQFELRSVLCCIQFVLRSFCAAFGLVCVESTFC